MKITAVLIFFFAGYGVGSALVQLVSLFVS